MCVLFYSSFVCISAFANVYFKTTIIKQNIKTILIAGVPASQALPGFLITAPPSLCAVRSCHWCNWRANSVDSKPPQKRGQEAGFCCKKGFIWPTCRVLKSEIDCGSWLAWEYMSAHQQCGLFYPLGWCLALSSGLVQSLGSCVVNRVFTIRLV